MVLASFIGVYAGQELVTETSKGILKRAWDIITDAHPDIKEITEPMDLVAKVQIVQSIVREIVDEIEIDGLIPSKPLQISLKQMQDILDDIHQDIQVIKEGVALHHTLWFHRFRVPAYYIIIKKLKRDKNAMDSRLDNLVRVIALFRQSQSTQQSTQQNTPWALPDKKFCQSHPYKRFYQPGKVNQSDDIFDDEFDLDANSYDEVQSNEVQSNEGSQLEN